MEHLRLMSTLSYPLGILDERDKAAEIEHIRARIVILEAELAEGRRLDAIIVQGLGARIAQLETALTIIRNLGYHEPAECAAVASDALGGAEHGSEKDASLRALLAERDAALAAPKGPT